MASTSSGANITKQSKYFAPPHSIDELPLTIRYGLIAVGICGLASFLSTLSLFSTLVYRLFTWRAHYKSFLGYNQYVMLFMNLILADLCQATAFVISFYWLGKNAILAPTATCTAQGFLLHFGDVSSAFFVLCIALHTFITAARGIRLAYSTFTLAISFAWLAALLLTIIGLAIHKETYFVRAGAWCWVSNDYEPERLGLHYFWLFLSEFGLLVIYAVIFFTLRQKTASLFAGQQRGDAGPANKDTVKAVNRITKLMMLYPLCYAMLTLPISAVRMWSMANDGRAPSDATQCVMGALLASCGWVDCLLYSLTRKRLMRETMGGTGSSGNGSRLAHEFKQLGCRDPNNAILQTRTFEVTSESVDASVDEEVPATGGYSEISSGLGSRARRKKKVPALEKVYELGSGNEEVVTPATPANAKSARVSEDSGEGESSPANQLRRKKAFDVLPKTPPTEHSTPPE